MTPARHRRRRSGRSRSQEHPVAPGLPSALGQDWPSTLSSLVKPTRHFPSRECSTQRRPRGVGLRLIRIANNGAPGHRQRVVHVHPSGFPEPADFLIALTITIIVVPETVALPEPVSGTAVIN